MDEQKSNTAQNNFNLLWQIIDERYCFFGEKDVDWDEVYDHYYHDWASYGDKDPSSPHLFGTIAMMLEELRDGHVCLSDGFTTRTFTGWYTPYLENFDLDRISFYTNRRTGYLNNETTFSILPESIGYLRCPSLSEKFNRNDLDNAIARFEGLKGVIIDVRNNGGGLVSEAYTLASKFVREKTHIGYVRYKTGKGHDDFSDYYARHVKPDGLHRFHGKVVIITNRRVYSAANLFVSMMSNLPQVYTMGDRTGGGGGVPVSAELYNGWTVELSTNPVFDTGKRSIESGIEPDYSIALSTKDPQKDNIIEAAKTWILAK
ncbi:MAG: S41 family peptidase [Bacteroidales bacterium]|jgi:hypothetical protein|nr:S41 family peptidase [Bacteroidales bacterium]